MRSRLLCRTPPLSLSESQILEEGSRYPRSIHGLLGSGDKASQAKDIAKAQQLAKDFEE